VDNVTIIDGKTNSVISTIEVGNAPYALCYNSINNKVYCANNGPPDYTVTVIDGENDNVIKTIPVGYGPRSFAWDPVQNQIYVANSGSSNVSVIRDTLVVNIPVFTVMPTSIDFGDVLVDSSKTDTVTVTNRGNATLNITSVVSDTPEFAVTPSTGSLEPDVSMRFYITFAPTDSGMETGNIIFTHNAMTSPDTVTVTGTGVELGIEETEGDVIPAFYALSQNYPNPFKTQTLIRYQLPKSNVVTIVIYNVSGQRIKTLVNEHKDAGYYTVYWDGRKVSNGVYFCRMVAGEYTSVKKILLLR